MPLSDVFQKGTKFKIIHQNYLSSDGSRRIAPALAAWNWLVQNPEEDFASEADNKDVTFTYPALTAQYAVLVQGSNGWNNYKGLTWKVTHNKTWDKIFRFFGCKKGWDTMNDTRYLAQAKHELQHIFRPKDEITTKAEAFMATIRRQADIVVGVHIRHGDYKDFFGGLFYYTLEEYHKFMLKIKAIYPAKKVAFFISSNASFSTDIFNDCLCFRFEKEPSGDILDLHTLSLCDRILGPWSTYSRWASFIGEVPLCCIKDRNQQFSEDSFSVISDFYHFENGEHTVEYWLKGVEGRGYDLLGNAIKRPSSKS